MNETTNTTTRHAPSEGAALEADAAGTSHPQLGATPVAPDDAQAEAPIRAALAQLERVLDTVERRPAAQVRRRLQRRALVGLRGDLDPRSLAWLSALRGARSGGGLVREEIAR